MRVTLSPRAEKELKKLPKISQIAIARKIRLIRDEPKIKAEEKLEGYENIFRVRVVNYRIVYQKNRQRIYVILIGHRKEVYRLAKRLLG